MIKNNNIKNEEQIDDNISYFSKRECLTKLEKLYEFYRKSEGYNPINKDLESKFWVKSLTECSKPKCPEGYYGLYGKCAPW